MPWKVKTPMSERTEFIQLAQLADTNIRQLCRQFGISPKTGYKWLNRYQANGMQGLADQSRCPIHSPDRTPPLMEQAVISVRRDHPAWGGKKIHIILTRKGMTSVPRPSTITDILHRHGMIDTEQSQQHQPWQRFEAADPNALWQIDFKGYFRMLEGRCYPLTVIDDYSRFAVGIDACRNQTRETVQRCLQTMFQHYGLPQRMLADNGPPWGSLVREHRLTELSAWLIRLGISVVYSRPLHPQSKGKNERLNKTIGIEVIGRRIFRNWNDCQQEFNRWREEYNTIRPHEALGMAVPLSRYRQSPREFPSVLPPVEYERGTIVRKVAEGGTISFHHRQYHVGKGLIGQWVAVRPRSIDGVFSVYYCHQRVQQIDLRNQVESR
jgi:transposase InsO family protein